jgi:hypothetical protein
VLESLLLMQMTHQHLLTSTDLRCLVAQVSSRGLHQRLDPTLVSSDDVAAVFLSVDKCTFHNITKRKFKTETSLNDLRRSWGGATIVPWMEEDCAQPQVHAIGGKQLGKCKKLGDIGSHQACSNGSRGRSSLWNSGGE